MQEDQNEGERHQDDVREAHSRARIHLFETVEGEAAECLPYLEQQIALLKPKIMLAVGRIASQNLLRTEVTLGRLRQQVHRFGLSQVPLVVTYHPAYLLRTPADKRKAWEDLKFAREVCARV